MCIVHFINTQAKKSSIRHRNGSQKHRKMDDMNNHRNMIIVEGQWSKDKAVNAVSITKINHCFFERNPRNIKFL